MKTFFFSTVQLIIIFILLFTANLTFSQVKNTWKGGTPGMEQDWNCHKNWSNYKVPDEFSDVIVSDVSSTSLALPILSAGTVEVNSLFLESGANLIIGKEAKLIVHQTATGVFPPNITVEGSLLLLDEAGPVLAKTSDFRLPMKQ